MTDDVFPVVIIGGGLAGLTAAAHLAYRGIEPLVLEADNEWSGGRLSGGEPDVFTYQGRQWSFPTEHGMHALWGAYWNTDIMLSRFLDVELNISRGEEWINRWGNQVRYVEAGTPIRYGIIPAPLHYLQLLLRPRFWGTITPLDFLSLPGFLTSILLTLSFDPIREQIALDGLTLKDYFMLWTPNLKATFTGIGVNMLAADAEHIPLASYIAAMRFYTMLRRDFWTLRYLPTNAHDALVHPLETKIDELGGKVVNGARARQLQWCDDHWQVRFEDVRLGGHRVLRAQYVILATEPHAAHQILEDSPHTPVDELVFPAVTRNSTVRMWFDITPRDGAAAGMFTGDFLMDNFFWMHRLHREFEIWHEQTGGSVLEVHIYNRDTLLDLSDQAILVQIIAEVYRAFPELRGHLVHSAYRNNGYTQTLFRVPDQRSLHVTTPWPQLLACGDWIGHPHPSLNMERSVVTAIAAANEILEQHGLEAYEILDPPPPEILVRIIGLFMRGGRILLGPAIRQLYRQWKRVKI